MNVVCYGHFPDKMFHDTWGKIQKKVPELGLELHRTLESFISRLRQPGRNIALTMLYIDDKKTLFDLMELRFLLNDFPIIILLSDQEPEMLEFCHKLKPRVILYTSWKMKDVRSVLERCISKYCNGKK